MQILDLRYYSGSITDDIYQTEFQQQGLDTGDYYTMWLNGDSDDVELNIEYYYGQGVCQIYNLNKVKRINKPIVWYWYSGYVPTTLYLTNCEYICPSCFQGQNFNRIVLKNECMLDEFAFADSEISNININYCKSIGAHCFQNCHNLSGKIYIDHIENVCIYTGTFENCENIRQIILPKECEICLDAFKGCTRLNTLGNINYVNILHAGSLTDCGIVLDDNTTYMDHYSTIENGSIAAQNATFIINRYKIYNNDTFNINDSNGNVVVNGTNISKYTVDHKSLVIMKIGNLITTTIKRNDIFKYESDTKWVCTTNDNYIYINNNRIKLYARPIPEDPHVTYELDKCANGRFYLENNIQLIEYIPPTAKEFRYKITNVQYSGGEDQFVDLIKNKLIGRCFYYKNGEYESKTSYGNDNARITIQKNFSDYSFVLSGTNCLIYDDNIASVIQDGEGSSIIPDIDSVTLYVVYCIKEKGSEAVHYTYVDVTLTRNKVSTNIQAKDYKFHIKNIEYVSGDETVFSEAQKLLNCEFIYVSGDLEHAMYGINGTETSICEVDKLTGGTIQYTFSVIGSALVVDPMVDVKEKYMNHDDTVTFNGAYCYLDHLTAQITFTFRCELTI